MGEVTSLVNNWVAVINQEKADEKTICSVQKLTNSRLTFFSCFLLAITAKFV